MIPVCNVNCFSDLSELKDINFQVIKIDKGRYSQHVCNNIMAFDIETSNGYFNGSSVEKFSHKNALDDSYYKHRVKVSCMYIWQFAIETHIALCPIKVFYGRTWDEFNNFLSLLTEEVRLQAFHPKRRIEQNRELCIEQAMKFKMNIKMFIYDHNLGFEFVHLLNIDEVRDEFGSHSRKGVGHTFARTPQKPIKTFLNRNKISVEFRDTYILTQMSLDEWCSTQKLPVKKLKEPDDFYDDIFTPNSSMELLNRKYDRTAYCINDVVSMIYGMDKYREKYGDLVNIPLTQTGEVRRVCVRDVALANPSWALDCAYVTKSYDLHMYRVLNNLFTAGWTHANPFYSNTVLGHIFPENSPHNMFVRHFDFASDYPTQMCTRTFALGEWIECTDEYDMLEATDLTDPDLLFHYIVRVKCKGVKAKTQNTFWSSSKCLWMDEDGRVVDCECEDGKHHKSYIINCHSDNGKILTCDEVVMDITDIDWDIFRRAYDIEDYEVITCWKSRAGYLPYELISIILEFFEKKTKLKRDEDAGPDQGESQEDFESMITLYNWMKQCINAIFGVCCTRTITDAVEFIDSEWTKIPLTEDTFKRKILETDEEKSFVTFQIGCWVTAWAHWALWSDLILQERKDGTLMDTHVIYGDTDSLFGLFDDEDMSIIDKYNKDNELRQEIVCEHYKIYNLELSKFRPKTRKGEVKVLGKFEEEQGKVGERIVRFKTLGAKRYVYEQENGNCKTTIAGLPKSAGAAKIKKCSDLTNGTKWTTSESHKKSAFYNFNQPECVWKDEDGVEYHSYEKFGCVIMPVSFDMSMSTEYVKLLTSILNGKDATYNSDMQNVHCGLLSY